MTKRVAAQHARAAVATQSRGLYTSYPQHPSNAPTPVLSQSTSSTGIPSHVPQPVKLNLSVGQAQTPSGLPIVEKRTHKPTSLDKTSISRLRDILPTDSPYWESLTMERKVEDRILRKQLAIADASFRVRRVQRVLKILVSNEANNVRTGYPDEEPKWTLRVEGRLEEPQDAPFKPVGPVHPSLRFTNLLKSFVAIIGDQEAIEWRKGITVEGGKDDGASGDTKIEPPTKKIATEEGAKDRPQTTGPIYTQLPGDSPPQDRIEVTRRGDTSIPIKIILTLDPQPVVFKLTPQMSNLLNLTTASRPQVIMALWQYVKLNRLQESEEKKVIRVDANLRDLFRIPQEVTTITFAELPNYIQTHLLPLDPIIIDYDIGVERQFHVLDRVIEVNLEVEERPLYSQPTFSQTLASTSSPIPHSGKQLTGPSYSSLYDLQRQIQECEQEQRDLAEALLESFQTLHWVKRYVNDPLGTHHTLFNKTCENFDAIIGQARVSLAEINGGEAFLKGDDEMEDAIEDYLEYQSYLKANIPPNLLQSTSGSTAVSAPPTPIPQLQQL